MRAPQDGRCHAGEVLLTSMVGNAAGLQRFRVFTVDRNMHRSNPVIVAEADAEVGARTYESSAFGVSSVAAVIGDPMKGCPAVERGGMSG